MVFLVVVLACLVVFSVFFVMAFLTAYYMSCGMSYVVPWLFVEFFSSRECHKSWIFSYGRD